ncbi:MAG: hypothetical protein HC844_08215 [Tabrizicola sp.]|nr:hypothetical protein [Tabrizicola sp.]
MPSKPVELLRGRNVAVTTQTVTSGNTIWRIEELDGLEVRTIEGKETVGLQVFMMGAVVMLIGATLAGPLGLVGGVVMMILAPLTERRFAMSYLLVRPRTKERELEVVYSSVDRRQVEKMMQAIEIARSWSKQVELGGTP